LLQKQEKLQEEQETLPEEKAFLKVADFLEN